MKKYLHFSRFLVLLVGLLTLSANSAWGETKTNSWDLTSSSSDWTASGNEAYFSQPYGYKKANGTLTNKNIADFSTAGITEIKVGFKCLQNGATTSKLTIYLVDKDGNTIGDGVVVTPVDASAASKTTYQYATFTSDFAGATGFMMKVTTFGKNILVNGAEYTITYSSSSVTYTDYLTECESCDPVDTELSVTAQATTLTIGSNDQASTTLSTSGGNGGAVKYSVTPNTATITDNSITFKAAGTYTVTASQEKTDGKCSQSATVEITVNPRQYTLTFVDRGGTHKTVTQYAGTEVAEPTAPTGVCTDPIHYVFDGWAEATVSEGSTSYAKVNFPYTMPKNNTTKLYAVYKYVEDGALSNDFNSVDVDNGDLVSGEEYVLTALYSDNTEHALSSKLAETGKYQSKEVAVIGVDKDGDTKDDYYQLTTTDKEIIWTLTGDADNGYSFKNASTGTFLTNSNGTLGLSETADTKFTISHPDAKNWEVDVKLKDDTKYLSGYYKNASSGVWFNLYSYSTLNLYLYKRAVAAKYTTSPVCGPHVGVSGDVRITSANGVRVDAHTKISVRATNLDKNEHSAAVSIKAESNNPNFKIKRWGTTGDGTGNSLTLATNIPAANYEDSLCITYTPTASNTTESATITLTAYKYNGTTPYATNTITVQGHSLPERFVIAAQSATGWVALPNTLGSSSSANVPNAEDISNDVDPSDNPTKLTTAPSNVIYTAAARADKYKNNSQTGLRFTVDGTQFLRASTSDTKVWLPTDNSQDMQSWTLRTEDFVNYQARLDSAEAGRYLAYNSGAGRIGHYKATTPIRFLPFDAECTRLLAPANLKVTQVKSTAITLTWDAVTGATGYAYSTDDGSTWTEMGNVLTYTITGLEAKTAYTIWVKGVVPADDTDCSYHGTVSATTTNCNDVPYDISYTSDVNSITLSWTMTSATATVQVFSDAEGTTPVGSYEGKTSPCTITGLTKATTYYVKISAGGTCPSELVEVSTERPQLDVVEWKPNGIDVAINTNEKISVVLENQVTKGSGTGLIADELFFSKYFEATGNVKLVAVYNGTGHEVNVTNYTIKYGKTSWESYYIKLGEFTKVKNTMAAGEEVILYSSQGNGDDSEIMKCVSAAYPDAPWQLVTTSNSGGNGLLSFAGDKTIALYKDNTLLDVIGAITSKGVPTNTGTSMQKPSWGDAKGWTCETGLSIEDGTEIGISTNRCLLVRKNTVKSGAKAAAKDTTDFATLCDEWLGQHVPDNDADNGVQASCDNFAYVGTFDYSGYYTTYDSLTTVEFEESSRNPDGTVTIPINRMDTLACKGLKIIAADEKGNVLTTRDYKVPILVTRNATTSDQLFSHFGGDTCKKCDVVVRNNATLTKAADKTANDKPQVRDVMVYEGSSLVVPINTNYTVNSLSLRRREDAVAVADVAGTLNLSSTSDKPVYLDMRINAENWHWFTLPYDCAIADVTWSNGQPAEYGKDWFLMYYDGARRATGVDSGNWKEYTGNTIAAGQGFIIGIKGDGNDKHAFELRFPMAKEVIKAEKDNKDVAGMKAYGAGTDIRPNHKGWNLVGNPYLNYYKKEGNINSFKGLQLSKLIYDDATGWWSLNGDNLPYMVIPQNFGWSAYEQVLVSSRDLEPFTAYFIQVGKDGDRDGQDYSVNFISSNRGKSPKAALMTSAAEEAEEEPVITGIVLRNAQGEEDETSLVIAEQFGSSYEMGADFFKWFGDYYKYYTLPVLYSIGDDGGKRAFNAVNEAGAKQSIPLGMYAARDGEYTFSLNTRSDLSRVDKVWLYDAESGLYTDLLRENYTFATTRTEGSGRFFLSVVLKEKEITTGAADVRYGELRLSTDKQSLVVRGLPEAAEVWVYDPSGKLLHHELTRHYERHYAVPQQGTYLVRVESKDGAVTLRGVCR